MQLTGAQVAAIEQRGISNVRAIPIAAELAGLTLNVACAVIEKESRGANIYGHDHGGVYSTAALGRPAAGLVTAPNFGVFLIKVIAGATSNGVGPCQITWAGDLPDGRSGGYFRLMFEQGLRPWVPAENMQFGFRKLAAALHGEGGDIAKAGTLYNAGNLRSGVNAYGRDLARLAGVYHSLLS